MATVECLFSKSFCSGKVLILCLEIKFFGGCFVTVGVSGFPASLVFSLGYMRQK